jgi:hypothetical protein
LCEILAGNVLDPLRIKGTDGGLVRGPSIGRSGGLGGRLRAGVAGGKNGKYREKKREMAKVRNEVASWAAVEFFLG